MFSSQGTMPSFNQHSTKSVESMRRIYLYADQAAEDCEKQMFVGCNLVKGECECGLKFACSNPYQFSSQHLCYVEQNVGKREYCG